jgi:hypothetical protein
MFEEIKIFRPRDKTLSCVHWVDCYSCADWCVEFRGNEGSSYDYFCQKHLDELKEKINKEKPH